MEENSKKLKQDIENAQKNIAKLADRLIEFTSGISFSEIEKEISSLINIIKKEEKKSKKILKNLLFKNTNSIDEKNKVKLTRNYTYLEHSKIKLKKQILVLNDLEKDVRMDLEILSPFLNAPKIKKESIILSQEVAKQLIQQIALIKSQSNNLINTIDEILTSVLALWQIDKINKNLKDTDFTNILALSDTVLITCKKYESCINDVKKITK